MKKTIIILFLILGCTQQNMVIEEEEDAYDIPEQIFEIKRHKKESLNQIINDQALIVIDVDTIIDFDTTYIIKYKLNVYLK